MERDGILCNADGSKRIGNNTLVDLALMIAEIYIGEMEIMVKVIVNLINKNNYDDVQILLCADTSLSVKNHSPPNAGR